MAPKFDRDRLKNWQPAPNLGRENAAERQAWLQQVVATGEEFNASLTSSRDLPRGISMISGRAADRPNQQRSDLKIPREKRALREVVANISDIRTIDAYSSDNPSYQPFLSMLNKVWKSVYFESKFPGKFKRAVQWMVPGGYAYMSPVYRNLYPSSRSARRIDFDVFSSQDCLPFQLPDDNSVQGAFAWTRILYKPVYMGHSMFPKFQNQLKPIARRRYSGNISKDRIALAERFRNDMRTASGQAQGGNWTEQMMEFRYTTVRDLSINETKEPKAMGTPGGLESYIVPFVGQQIPTGEMTRTVTGELIRKMRKAEEEDCYLYPNLRLFISQTGMTQPIYDGPAFDWHGMHPLVRISDDGHIPGDIHHAGDELQHRLQPPPILRAKILVVRPRHQAGDQHQVRHDMVVPDCLLFVHTVGKRLRERLPFQLRPRLARPLRALAPQWPGKRADV